MIAFSQNTIGSYFGGVLKLFHTTVYCIISFQIVISTISGTLAEPYVTKRMQIPTKKYVELLCEQSLQGFLVPLAYNLLIIFACAVYGFLTRKLPENFNESWYIFVSVSTTAFLWMVFLPTYFTMFYAHHQAAILAFCLIVNAAITLLCLFVPKVYALYFVEESDIKFSAAGQSHSSGPISTHLSSRNQVAPLPVVSLPPHEEQRE